MNYLSGVAVERGGGLGARDDTYGGDKFATETGVADPELEKQRQELLAQISGMGTPFGGQDISTILAGITREGIGADMTPEQYFNFRQQLMSADPTPGNQAYKDAFPWSSGAGVTALATPTLSLLKGIGKGLSGLIPQDAKTMMGDVYDAAGKLIPKDAKIMGKDVYDAAGKLIPEDAKIMMGNFGAGIGNIFGTKPEWTGFDNKLFYDTSTPVQGDGNNMNAWQNPYDKWGDAEPEIPEDEDEDEDDVVDLTPTPTPYPVYGEGVAGLDWSQFGPHFGPQYPGHYSHWGSGYANGGIARLFNQHG